MIGLSACGGATGDDMVVALLGIGLLALALAGAQHRFPKSLHHWALAFGAAVASVLGWWGLFLIVGWREVDDYGLDRFAGKLACLAAGVYGALAALVLVLTSDRPIPHRDTPDCPAPRPDLSAGVAQCHS